MFCSPTQFWIGWIAIAFLFTGGLWLVWKRVSMDKKYAQAVANHQKNYENAIAKTVITYEQATEKTLETQREYLAMMKELKADEVPEPDAYYPK